MKKFTALFLSFMLLGLIVNAQVVMNTTGSYSQGFNGLSNTGTVGWFNNTTIANWYAGQAAGTLSSYVAGNGSANTGAFYSFGTTGATERCLGSISSGTPVAFSYGVLMQNTSATTITNMTITYAGEQWRCGGKTTLDTLKFYYKVSATSITDPSPADNSTWTPVTALHFSSPIAVATAGALNGNLPANQVVFANISIPSLNVPAGSYIFLKWHDINEAGGDHALGVDSLTINWTVPTGNTVATGLITGSPYCVTASTGVATNVPFTISGSYNAGNVFTAYLSDASGSFASEVAIGTLTSQVAGTISATIPAGTPTGTGYRIRVKASDPVTTGTDNGINLVVGLGVPQVAAASALPASNAVNLSWTNPSGCYDQLMIVAKPTATIAGNATGDGTAYIANSTDITDPLNTAFDGTGVVVYKSNTPGTSASITGLTNGTPYYFRFFTRLGTEWNNNIEISATPTAIPQVVISEIMYNDPSGGATGDSLEFLEIHNNESVPVNISKWNFTAGVTYMFPMGTIMAPGQYMVIAKNDTAFANFFSAVPTAQFTGALSNSGERISLNDSIGNVVDSLTYGTGGSWPTSPNGNGPSLVLCNMSSDNALPGSWSAANTFVDSLNHIAVYATPFAACPVVGDLTPPVAIAAYATSLSDVVVVFNEAMQLAAAQTTSHYTFLTAATGSATLRPTKDSVSLVLSTPLITAVTDTLYVTGVVDTSGNTMSLTYKFPIVFGIIPPPLVDTIIYFNFPNVPDDSLADGGITANLAKLIFRDASFTGNYSYTAGASTQSISSIGWANGINTKFWEIEFSTWLYDSIRFSSKQRSSPSGPRNFRTEYSLDGSTWIAVTIGTVVCANNFSSGVLNNVSLPAACYSQPSVHLRWIMTSDSAVEIGDTVVATGTSRIDDIYVTGRYNPILGIDCNNNCKPLEFAVYPNPANESVTIQLEKDAAVNIEILSITGMLMHSELLSGSQFRLDVSDLAAGLYIIRMHNTADQSVSIKKLSVK